MKQINIQREYQKLSEQLIKQTTIFPKPHRDCNYWHLHVPAAQALFNAEFVNSELRFQCAQMLIDRTFHLAQIAPQYHEEIRVVAAIRPENLWESQIIVFFGPDYFNNFFDRNTETQRWSKLEIQSLVGEWNLNCPTNFSERGYEETIKEMVDDEIEIYTGQIWFIGQL